MTDTKNALAELANDLELIASGTMPPTMNMRIRKAQRIVAVLARMKPDQFACGCFRNLIDNCSSIAEEGEKNENS